MTFVPRDNDQLPVPLGLPEEYARKPRTDLVPQVRPDWSDVFGAAFRIDNTIASALASESLRTGTDQTNDPDYNPWPDITQTDYEPYWERFVSSQSSRMTQAIKADIDRELEDRRTLEAAGFPRALSATLVASLLDWPTLLPGGAFVRSAGAGFSAARTAASVGAASGVAAGTGEAALHLTQQTRTLEESAAIIGGSVVIGATLGAGLAKALSRSELRALERQVERDLYSNAPLPADEYEAATRAMVDDARSVGAAAVVRDSLDDLEIAGRAGSAVARATYKLNPGLRGATSPSARMRETMDGLLENSFYLKKHLEGRTSGPAVETLTKEWERGALSAAVSRNRELYSAARKEGWNGSYYDFRIAVGRAMRRSDTDAEGNQFVSEAAQEWRKSVFEPLKERAIAAGLLPEDVSVETASSYFSRLYNRRLIEAREPEFKEIVRNWARQMYDSDVDRIRREFDQKIRETRARGGKDVARKIARLEGERDRDIGVLLPKDDYAEDVAGEIFNKITGRGDEFPLTDYRLDVKARGPLKERTFNIKDELIEEFLESDVDLVGRRYARIMAADVEMKEKFGDVTLAPQVKEIRDDYRRLRELAGNQEGLNQKQREKMLQKLSARERDDVGDLLAVRDLLRGVYKPDLQSSNFGRIMRGANQFNYIRMMGDFIVSSLPELARPFMVHGLSRVMGQGVAPLLTNLKAVKLSVGEARKAGLVSERVLNSRIATLAEITDPYSMSHPMERFLENTSTMFSKFNGITFYTDWMKSFSSVLTQNRIVTNALDYGRLGKSEKAYMAFLGIDDGMAQRISRQFREFGESIDSVRVANTDSWTDDLARKVYRAAVTKDVDSIIVVPGKGDIPLFAKTPLGAALIQFKSFFLAAHQRMLIRGLQEAEFRGAAGWSGFASSVLAMSTIGMFTYWLKQMQRNREIPASFADNPGAWIAEGLDWSGLFAVMFEISNTAEKIGVPGIKAALSSPFGEADTGSRFVSRNISGTLGGPTVGTVEDIAMLLGFPFKDQTTEADINRVRRLLPFSTLPFIRAPLEHYILPELKEELVD